MLIASMVVKVNPEYAEQTSEQLQKHPNFTSYGVHQQNSIILVAEADSTEQLEALTTGILADYDNVLGVFPTYLSNAEI